MKPEIRELGCKSILTPSRIPGIDYTVNPYAGCMHGCVYCYAQFMHFNRNRGGVWGSFCDVRINAPSLFRKQIRRAKPGLISLSTATDAYQPCERKYGLTRQILETLAHLPFGLSILTKSDLVLRDLDLMKSFKTGDCEVGFSFSTGDDRVSRLLEPGAPLPSERIRAVRAVHGSGIRTWAFIAPVIPGITIQTLGPLFDALSDSVDSILIDMLNIRYGIPDRLWSVLRNGASGQTVHWIRSGRLKQLMHMEEQEIVERIARMDSRTRAKVKFC
ncbi:radical SAM protein [bacterium]|nr:radical SAM protein [bacterium]